MTLEIIDEYGKIVNEENPIIVEHNGTLGGETTTNLALKNTSSSTFYRNIFLSVNMSPPVLTSLYVEGEVVPNFMSKKHVAFIGPNGRQGFQLRTAVPPNTAQRIVRGITLRTVSTAYPVP